MVAEQDKEGLDIGRYADAEALGKSAADHLTWAAELVAAQKEMERRAADAETRIDSRQLANHGTCAQPSSAWAASRRPAVAHAVAAATSARPGSSMPPSGRVNGASRSSSTSRKRVWSAGDSSARIADADGEMSASVSNTSSDVG